MTTRLLCLTHILLQTDSYTETAWINEYEGVKVFTSSLGHHNISMGSDVHLNLVAAGVLWVTEKLEHDGSAARGFDQGNRGLGWIDLLDDSLDGWVESGGAVDWRAGGWYDGKKVWPTIDNSSVGESFSLDGGVLKVEGDQRNLFYDGAIAGRIL